MVETIALLLGGCVVGGGLVTLGIQMGYRMARHEPPLPGVKLPVIQADDMPGPFSGREEAGPQGGGGTRRGTGGS